MFNKPSLLLKLLLTLLLGFFPLKTNAQITPSLDGTGTIITPNGNQINITGGSLNQNQTNLFHSFSQFNLNQNQIANFLSQPNIINILGRITGGNPSNINGLIQVTGSNANLYLINPSGIIFGNHASLNVLGDFTATTATGIGFGNNTYFHAFGNNNYVALIGNPQSFIFNITQPGTIINTGNLTVNPGNNISLIGGSINQTGTITANQGNINIIAVPGTSILKISQPNNILTLEIDTNNLQSDKITPLSLPGLLTGNGVNNISGNINVGGGKAQILGDRIALQNANINANGTKGGGEVLIGGDFQGKGNIPNAKRVFIDKNSVINANSLLQGDGGKIIIWSDETTRFYGTVNAKGYNGGFVEISGKNYLDFIGKVDLSASQGKIGTLLLDPTNITIISGGNTPVELTQNDQFADNPGTDNNINNGTINNATANVILQATGNINFNAPINITTSGVGITAESQGNIFINPSADITTNGGDVTLTADFNNTGAGRVSINSNITTSGGNFTAKGRTLLNDGIGIFQGSGININTGSGNISLTGTSNGNLTTARGIEIQGNLITTSGNIILTGNQTNINGNAEGILISSSILSNSGNIILTGTSSGNGVNARGTSLSGNITTTSGNINITGNIPNVNGNTQGLFISSTIKSDNGNINLTGTSLSNNTLSRGIEIQGNVITTINGNIKINGTSPGTGISSLGNITSNIGDITLTGNNTSSSLPGWGILLQGNNLSTGTGNITLTGNSLGSNQGIAIAQNIITNTGNITINADTLDLNPGFGNPTNITGNGILNLLPLNANTNITLGGVTSSQTTYLNDVELNKIANGFTSIIIGRTDSSGNIDLGNTVIFNDPVVLRSPLGTIIINSNIQGLDNASITLIGNTTLNNNITTNNNNINFNSSVTVSNSSTLNAGTSTINFNNTLTDNNTLTAIADEINFIGNVSGNGNLTLQPFTSSQNIIVGSANNATSSLDITLSEINLFQSGLNQVTIGGDNTSGNINLAGNVTFNNPVVLRSPVGTGSINTNGFDITGTNNASITLLANQNITANNITTSGKNINISGANIITGNINTQIFGGLGIVGGSVNLSAGNSIQTGTIDTWINQGSGGNINLTLTNSTGSIVTGNLTSLTFDFNFGGNVNINANSGNIRTGRINAYANRSNDRGGDIIITGGTIITDGLNDDHIDAYTFIDAQGGIISLNATNSMTFGNISNNNNTISINGPVSLNANTSINSFGGGIFFANTVNGSNDLTVNSGTGNIIFNSALGNQTALNNLTLTGDEINFANTVTGRGNLTLEPFTPTRNIIIGGVSNINTNTLNLLTSEITALQNGFSSITIGRSDGSGTINIAGNVTFNDPLTLRSPSNTIIINNPLTLTDNSSLTFNSPNVLLNANITQSNQSLNITGNNITLGANVTLSGNVDVNLNSPLDFNNIGTDKTLTILANRDIVINQPIRDTNPGNDQLNILLNSTSGQIQVNSNINTEGGNFTASGNTVLNNGIGISLSSGLNINTGSGNISLTGRSNGNGTTARGVNIEGNLTTTTGNITLTGNQTNINGNAEGIFISSPILSNSGNIILQGTSSGNGVNARGIGVSGNMTTNGNITLTGNSNGNSQGIFITSSTILSNSGNITLTGTSSGNDILARGINLEGNITTTSGNIYLTGNNNNSNSNAEGIITSGTIQSNSGNITLTGTSSGNGINARGLELQGNVITTSGNITLTGNNNNSNSNTQGIFVSQNIQSNSGNITLTGTSNGNGTLARGIELQGNVITTINGNITINGTSAGTGILSLGNITSNTGDIKLTGDNTSPTLSHWGMLLQGNNLSTTSGNITLTGNSSGVNANIAIAQNITSNTGNIIINADTLDLNPGFGNPTNIIGNGTLNLVPLNSNTTITIGGTFPSSTTYLNSIELTKIANGFNSIIIGRSDGTSTISIDGNTIFNDPVTLRSPSGTISITNPLTLTDNADLTFNSANVLLNANITHSNQSLNITGNNITLGANVTLSGNVDVNLNSPLDFNNIGTDKTLTILANGNVVINQSIRDTSPGNDQLNILLNSTSGQIQVNNNINTGGGNLIISGNQGISLNGAIASHTGNITLTSDNITLGNTAAITGNGVLTLQPSSLNQNLVIGGNLPTSFLTDSDLSKLNTGFNQVVIQSSTGNITLTSTTFNNPMSFQTGVLGKVDVQGNLTSSNSITFNTGLTNLGANITTTSGNINFNNPVTVTNNSTLTANDTINFGNIVAIANNNLVLIGNDINFNNTVSGTGTLTLSSNQDINIGGNLITSFLNQSDLTNLNPGFNQVVLQSGIGNITLNSSNFNNPTSFISSGNINILDHVSSNQSLSFNGLTNISANITTTSGNINFNNPVTVTNNSTLTANDTINFGNVVAIANNNLVLIGNDINFNNTVSGTGTLTLSSHQDINIGGNLPTSFLTDSDLSKLNTGFNQVVIQSSTGNITLTSTTFNNPMSFQTGVLGKVDVQGNLTSSNSITFNTGLTNLGANITTTSGNINFNNPVTLTNNSTLTANDTINFGNIVAIANHDLTLKSSNDITFNNNVSGTGNLTLIPSDPHQIINVGGTQTNNFDITTNTLSNIQTGLKTLIIGEENTLGNINIKPGNFINSLTVKSQGIILVEGLITGQNLASITLSGNTILNGGINTNSQPININGNVTLNNNIILDTAVIGDININGKIDGVNNDIILKSGLGDINVRDNVNVGKIEIDNLGNSTFNKTINANSLITNIGGNTVLNGNVTTVGEQNYRNGIKTTASLTLNSSNGDINTKDISGNGSITLKGNNVNSGNINIQGNVTLNSVIGSVNTGDINTSGITGGDIKITAIDSINIGKINSSGSVGNGGNVFIDPLNDIKVESINAQGGINGVGGNVYIQTENNIHIPGTFVDRNGQIASISSSGGIGGGDIIIIQKGPFLIGNSMVSGTSGVITTGNDNTLTPMRLIPDPLFIEKKIAIINQGDGNNNEGLQQLIKNTLEKNDIKIENTTGLLNILLTDNTRAITTKNVISNIDEPFTQEYGEYIGKNIAVDNLKNPQETLNEIETATGVKPALIYVLFTPSGNQIKTKESEKINIQDTDELEIIMITGKGNPVRKRIIGTTRTDVLKTAKNLRLAISNSRSDKTYMKPGKQMYEWIIAPIEQELKEQKINNLVFLMDGGLRSLPMAALSDGENFLIEKYSIGLMPSLSMTDTNYTDIKKTEVLAMGSDTFAKETLLAPLPAVPVEINVISAKLWRGKSFLNEQFTLENLKLQRSNKPYGIIHLATHAEFKPGNLENSYIQLWDGQLRLDKLRELGWDNPPVELLVLSACKTAIGDDNSELGFAGLAVAAGVKTAMGSLWYVSDEGTLGLMTNFYAKLQKAPIKSEALRQAQISMIRGEVRIEKGKLVTPNGTFDLPPELAKLDNMTLNNPYYWSGFVMIGNPW